MNPHHPVARLQRSIKAALPKGMQTAWWLIKITIPVSFGVMLLDYFGILRFMAQYTGPLFRMVGLPGVSAIVLVTSVFTNIYSVVAVLTVLHLPVRDGIILATMCLVSHGFIIESAVMKRTGSSVVRILLLRLAGSFVVAWMLNLVMPGSFTEQALVSIPVAGSFSDALYHWAVTIASTTLKILVLVNLLIIFQRILEEFGWIGRLEKPLSPLMRLMGLPDNTAISWLAANLIGLAYGSAIMFDQAERGKMSRADADLLNHHVALSHSQLEDPLLFLTLGYAIHWLIWPRLLIAFAAVWLRRAERRIFY